MTHHGLLMITGACRHESRGGEVIYPQYLSVTQQEYQKQSVGCRKKKRLEAVRLFGVFHDFSCVAEQVTDILDPVLEIARMQKASAVSSCFHWMKKDFKFVDSQLSKFPLQNKRQRQKVNDLDWNGLETMGFRGGDFVVLFPALDTCWSPVEGLL
uniref:Uncharacterized protein n=1 Tax=Magallana gigas TaxID=29159 RepID=A0A8W8LB31_MAGGI